MLFIIFLYIRFGIVLFSTMLNLEIHFDIIANLIQDCGPVSVKLAQKMSGRDDIFSKKMCNELKKLQEHNYFHSDKYSKKCVKNNKDLKIGKAFASGSIGQVYTGKFKNKKVAIKVLHPNIQNRIQLHLKILNIIISFLRCVPMIQNFVNAIDFNEFSEELYMQIDCKKEEMHTNDFHEIFTYTDMIIVPKCLYASNNYLVLEWIDCMHIDDFQKKHPMFKEETIPLVVCSFYKMFEINYFHGDMHFGNVKFKKHPMKEKPQLVLLDFGIVWKLKQENYKTWSDIYSNKNLGFTCPSMEKLIDCQINSNINVNADVKTYKKNLLNNYSQEINKFNRLLLANKKKSRQIVVREFLVNNTKSNYETGKYGVKQYFENKLMMEYSDFNFYFTVQSFHIYKGTYYNYDNLFLKSYKYGLDNNILSSSNYSWVLLLLINKYGRIPVKKL